MYKYTINELKSEIFRLENKLIDASPKDMKKVNKEIASLEKELEKFLELEPYHS